MDIYLGTVALERNRWSTREPSITASDYASCALRDGFAGIELWEEHYTLAPQSEREKLEASRAVKIFNCYIDFAAPAAGHMEKIADAAARLKPDAVKYNLAADRSALDVSLRNLRAFRAMLPAGTELVCECHPGTMMDSPAFAASVLDSLGEGYTRLVHTSTPLGDIREAFSLCGERITRVHAQRNNGDFIALRDDGETADRLSLMRSLGFSGTVTLEFTRNRIYGEKAYESCVADLAYLS